MKAKEIIKWLETNSLDNEDDDIRICREDFNELKEKCKEQNKDKVKKGRNHKTNYWELDLHDGEGYYKWKNL